MGMTRRAFVRSVGMGGAGALSTAFIIARGREELAALGIENVQVLPQVEPGTIRISGNENPRGPGQAALDTLQSRVSYKVGRYPDNTRTLSETIAGRYGAQAENVLLSTGSGALLGTAVRAFTSPERPLVTASVSYSSPLRTAQRLNTPVRMVPVTDELKLDLDGMAEAARGAGLVFVCNPNNPTSTFHGASAMSTFVSKVRSTSPDTAILVDEAYIDYSSDPVRGSAAQLALQNPKVFITRTFSKAYGMAGLRLGYALVPRVHRKRCSVGS